MDRIFGSCSIVVFGSGCVVYVDDKWFGLAEFNECMDDVVVGIGVIVRRVDADNYVKDRVVVGDCVSLCGDCCCVGCWFVVQ